MRYYLKDILMVYYVRVILFCGLCIKGVEIMEDFGKQIFNLQRFLIIQAKLNANTSEQISDSEAFAWSVGLYPLHSESKIAKDLESYFDISRDTVKYIIKYVDEEWTNKNNHSFYELESHFEQESTSSRIIDRIVLINTLRYCYLQRLFDDSLWDKLFFNNDNPIEANSICEEFSTDELKLLGW